MNIIIITNVTLKKKDWLLSVVITIKMELLTSLFYHVIIIINIKHFSQYNMRMFNFPFSKDYVKKGYFCSKGTSKRNNIFCRDFDLLNVMKLLKSPWRTPRKLSKNIKI